MELNGALSNPLQTHKDLVARLSGARAAGRKAANLGNRSPLPARAGAIKEAVVYTVADMPLTLRQIHAQCEELLACRVSYATVKDCVHKHGRGSGALFERVGHGVYRRRR